MSGQETARNRQRRNRGTCPVSATHGVVAVTGGLAIVLSFAYLHLRDPFSDTTLRVLFMAGVFTASVLAVDGLVRWMGHDRNARPRRANGDAERSFIKLGGFLLTLAMMAIPYLLFPEYRSQFYQPFYPALGYLSLPVLALAYPYIYLVDRRMARPRDGTYNMGLALLLRFGEIDRGVLRQHLLGWLVKAYFLPLMFVYSCDNLNSFLDYDFANHLDDYRAFYGVTYNFLYFIDVIAAAAAYAASLRLFDTHIRSVEPTVFGWAIAIMCYVPFWPLISTSYIKYEGAHSWTDWLSGFPLLYGIWGTLILGLVVVYVWATLAFGARFSNLTNRGIITNGPYRWTKHPAYIAKNLSWWLLSLPFLGPDPVDCIRACCLLLLLNFVYFLRARTEERHLALDPVYRDYAAWMRRHGLFRWVSLSLPGRLDDKTLHANALAYGEDQAQKAGQ